MGTHFMKHVRERRRLEKLAQERGYVSCATMLYDLYIVKQIPIERIAHDLYTPMFTFRKVFDECGIAIRTRGGRHNVKVEMTKELYDEVCREGVETVAARLGMDGFALRLRIAAYYKSLQEKK